MTVLVESNELVLRLDTLNGNGLTVGRLVKGDLSPTAFCGTQFSVW
jgi:hypothetical protein